MNSKLWVLIVILALMLVSINLPLQISAQSAEPTRLYSLAWSPEGDKIAGGSGYGLHLWDANGTLLIEHEIQGGIQSLAWRADSTQIALGQRDGKVSIWDIASEQLATSDRGHGNYPVTGIYWGEETIFSIGHVEGGTGIWHPTSLQLIFSDLSQLLNAHSVGGFDIAGSSDGSTLAQATEVGVDFSSIMAGEYLGTTDYYGLVFSIDWNSGGTRLVGGTDNGLVYIWDATTQQTLSILEGHVSRVETVAWSSLNVIASADSQNNIRLWNANIGQLITSISAASTILDWSPDGSKLVYGGEGISIEVIDESSLSAYGADDTARSQASSQPLSTVLSMCWNADGSRLILTHTDGTVSILDSNGELLGEFSFDGSDVSMLSCHSTDTNNAVVGVSERGVRNPVSIVSIDLASNALSDNVLATSLTLVKGALNPINSQIAIAGIEEYIGSRVEIWDLSSNRLIQTLHEESFGVMWSADGQRLFVANGAHQEIRVFETENWTLVTTIPIDLNSSRSIVPDTKLRKFAIVDHIRADDGSITTGHIRIWDIASQRQLFDKEISNFIRDISWNSDQQNIAIVVENLFILNIVTGSLSQPLAESFDLTAVAWQPNTNRLAYAYIDTDGHTGRLEFIELN